MIELKAFLIGICMIGMITGQNSPTEESFSEELLVRPLPDGTVFSHLQFTSTLQFSPQNTSSLNHFTLFPKSVAQIVQKFGTEQIQLTFTQGRWKEYNWGAPLRDAPSGVQLIASFLPSRNADNEWRSLIHALAGMFCASLDVLDETRSATPRYAFSDMTFQNDILEQESLRSEQLRWQQELLNNLEQVMRDRGEVPEGNWKEYNEMEEGRKIFGRNQERMKKFASNDTVNRIYYGELPEEAVCTENLTPWTKLLPCRSESGLGKLLHSLHLYNTLYHSMGITVRYSLPSHCNSIETCDSVTLELIQTLGVVFNTENLSEYEISTLYGEPVLSNCVLSGENSLVYVSLPQSSSSQHEEFEAISVTPKEHSTLHGLQIYNLNSGPLHLKLQVHDKALAQSALQRYIPRSPITVSRSALGYGDANGGILTQIINQSDEDLSVIYFEYIPWYFPIYFHSMRVYFGGNLVRLVDVANKWSFTPGEDHSIPSTIEIEFTLPARTTASFTYRHDKSFLQWTEHPPDAHRGSDISSACVSVIYDTKPNNLQLCGINWSPILNNQTEVQESAFQYRVYSEGLLVLLPTPDFSMPYNVITLTCTMFAIVFTTTINVLTRRFSYLTQGGEYSSGRLSMFLYRKVRDFLTQ